MPVASKKRLSADPTKNKRKAKATAVAKRDKKSSAPTTKLKPKTPAPKAGFDVKRRHELKRQALKVIKEVDAYIDLALDFINNPDEA